MTLTLRDLPFLSSARPAVAWTPAQLGSTLRVWLDADDASTITLNGSTVSQWRDKSGGARHFFQTFAAGQPTYVVSAINGRAAIQGRTAAGNQETGVQFGSFAFNGSGATIAGFLSVVANSQNNGVSQAFTTNPFRIQWGTRDGFVPQNVKYLPGGTINDGITITFEHWMNSPSLAGNPGALITTVNAAGQIQTHFNGASGAVLQRTWSNFTATGLFLPPRSFFTMPGLIGEFVLLVDPIGTSDREKLEGYLAHKWQGAGASNSLPAGHPFKAAPPTV